MDRTEAIELLKNAVPAKTMPDDEIGFFIEAISMAIAALEGKDTNVPNKWIPVSERLPEEKTNPNTHDFEEVLCSTTFGDVRVYKFGTPWGWEKPHFWHGGGIMDEYVEAWMPKPEPWEGGQNGQTD